jgi:heme O synthase-like polyprenyltransferase
MMRNVIFILLIVALLFAKPPEDVVQDVSKAARSLLTVAFQSVLGIAFLVLAYFIYLQKIQGRKKAEELWLFGAIALLILGLLMVLEAISYLANHFIF